MSRSQKITFIGLALIALLFVWFVVMGHGQGGDPGGRPPPPPWLKNIGRMLDSPGARITLEPPEITLQNGGAVNIPVAGWDGKPEVKTLRLTLKRGGTVHLASGDNEGDLPGPGDTPEDRRRTSIPIRSAGATVQLRCTSAPPCVLATD